MDEKKPEESSSKEKQVGLVAHYYTKLGVAIVELSDTLNVGDTIHIKGATTDFNQKIESMQIEHNSVEKAERGQSIGLKVQDHVREHDAVYKVE